MNVQFDGTTVVTQGIAGSAGILAWNTGFFFVAALCLLVGTGIAMAKPRLVNRRLVLNGTPVMLMLAIMFVSASGMVIAFDQVSDLVAPADAVETAECDDGGSALSGFVSAP